jgi:hypothetical protein
MVARVVSCTERRGPADRESARPCLLHSPPFQNVEALVAFLAGFYRDGVYVGMTTTCNFGACFVRQELS